MKVLVTGAGGYVGKFLVQFLAKQKHEVVALYRRTPLIHREVLGQVRWVRCDLGVNIKELESTEVIIHTATVHPYSRQLPSAVDYVDSNINATRNLLDYSVSCSAKLFIYLSTVTVHGNVFVKELREKTPQYEPDLLGMTKYLAERIVETYADRVPSVVLRLPGVVGPELLSLGRPWLCGVLKKALSHEPIKIYNGDSPFNNVTDLTDIGKLITLLMGHWTSGVDIFNLATREALPLRQVVQNIIHQTQSSSEIIEEKIDKNNFFINIENMLNQLQFTPKTTEKMIHDFVHVNM